MNKKVKNIVSILVVGLVIANFAHAGVISDAPSLSTVGMKILNFLLSAFGIVAIIMFVVSGIIYFFSNGNEKVMQVAKQAAMYSIVGVIMAMGSLIAIGTIGQFFK